DRDVSGPGDDVAGLGLRLGNPAAAVGDLAGGARQRDAGGLVGVVHEARAVHAAEGGAAPGVGGAHGGAGRVHDGAGGAGGGARSARGGGGGAAGGDAAVEGGAGLRADDPVDLEALGGLVVLDRRVGALAEHTVDREARAVRVQRRLQLLHGAAAGAPAELLGGVQGGRRGDRGGCVGRGRSGGGRSGRGARGGGRGLGRGAGEGGAEDDGAEDGGAAEAAGRGAGLAGRELSAAGETVGVVLSHDEREFLPVPTGGRGHSCGMS